MTDMPHGDDRFLADLDKLIDVPDYHDEFRAEVFARTLTDIRGRRQRRKILRCAVVALVYVGGLASGVFLNNGDDDPHSATQKSIESLLSRARSHFRAEYGRLNR